MRSDNGLMKRRISILVDAETARQAKQRAGEERHPLSDLIQDALVQCLSNGKTTVNERKRAYHLFCERPMKIPRSMFSKKMCWTHEQGEFVLAINLAVSKKILDTTGHPLHNPV
jgi:hypothetical protein